MARDDAHAAHLPVHARAASRARGRQLQGVDSPAPDLPLSPRGRGLGRGAGRFTDEQRWWLEKMAEHIASNLGIEAEDFGYAPFDQRGGLGRVHQLFGAELPKVIDELNRELVA
jgi:hypothetical protein